MKLTKLKAHKIKLAVDNILDKKSLSIRELSQVVGSMVASFPWVKYGKRFYRQCDNYKIKTLKKNGGNFEAKIFLPTECKPDLKWWSDNITVLENPIRKAKLQPRM